MDGWSSSVHASSSTTYRPVARVRVIAACSHAVAQAPPGGPTRASAAPPPSSVPEQEYRIAVGDQLDIKFFYNPELNEQVIVRGFGSQLVFVDGEVGKPGMVPILGAMTALQAISQAGGMKETARAGDVIIIRRGAPSKPVVFAVNLKKARTGTDLAQDVSLAPFDIIYVPRSRVSNVNVWLDHYIRRNIPLPFSLNYGVYR